MHEDPSVPLSLPHKMLDQVDLDDSLPHDVTYQDSEIPVHARIERDMNLLLALLGQYLIDDMCERCSAIYASI